MKLITWNVNSLKAREAFVASYLEEQRPDVLCMQELKLEEDAIPSGLFQEHGYELAAFGQRQWNGVAIASKLPIADIQRGIKGWNHEQARVITCTVDLSSVIRGATDTAATKLQLINLYCPQGQQEGSDQFEYKLDFFRKLRAWLAEHFAPDRPLLVVGDFNIAPRKTDVWDPTAFENVPTFHPLEHEEWKQLLAWGLEDAVYPFIEPGQFSFWDYRGAYFRENKGMRIDHILATAPAINWMTDASIDREARKKRNGLAPSDHAPVVALLEPGLPNRPRKRTRSRVVLIDGSSLIYRAYYSIPANLSTTAGLPTNAIYGFALMFGKILAGKRPAFGAMVFDAPSKTFRDEEFADYKANREAMPDELQQQLPHIDHLVEQHDFPILRIDGYEADDVIGTLTRLAQEAGHEVRIISADKDFVQLLGPDVRMVDTLRDIVYDEELAEKKWGVRPEAFVDHLAMLGDKIDNIPGVPGIGQKGSATLLQRFGSLDRVYENIDQLKGRQRANLIEFKQQAYLSQRLATIDTNVPLPVTVEELQLAEPNIEKINRVYREYEFYSLLSDEATHKSADDAAVAVLTCREPTQLAEFLKQRAGETLAVFVMHEPPALTGALLGIAVATPSNAVYLPLGPSAGSLGEQGLDAVRGYLEDDGQPKVVHNLRDTLSLLLRHRLRLEGVKGDTTLASFLIDPAKLLPHRLDQIVKEYLHRTLEPLKQLTGTGKSRQKLAELPLDDLATWSGKTAAAIADCWPKLEEKLTGVEQRDFLTTVSLPMSRLLAEMQLTGIRVDQDDLAAMGVEFAERKLEVEQQIYALAGNEFNVGSTKQLAKVLFEDLGLPVLKRTKTGYSTAADVLERLAKDHKIARLILRQRALAKLINTYTEVLQSAISPTDGRIHCTFQQTTGVSGRLITTDPDLQRTPIRTEDGKRIRQAFLPREDWTLISADWSQIELRVLGHFSQDPRLLEAFREEQDLHRATAAELFNVEPERVTSAQRDTGKTVNFATIYGQGATALGQQLEISRNEAKRMIDRYFEVYAGVRHWLDQTVEEADRVGFVTTLLGRRRFIPELSSRNFSDRAYGERIATNTPIQGSAADLCKLAMLAIARTFTERQFQAQMVLQIHDELLVESPPDEVDKVKRVVRDCMENPHPLTVPLKVDIGTGGNWAEAH